MVSKTEHWPQNKPMVVTGNRLGDGRVVWLGAETRWVEDVTEAAVFDGPSADAALETARAEERRQIVVGVYGVDVEISAQGPLPLRYREQIRAVGPSGRADLDRRLRGAALEIVARG